MVRTPDPTLGRLRRAGQALRIYAPGAVAMLLGLTIIAHRHLVNDARNGMGWWFSGGGGHANVGASVPITAAGRRFSCAQTDPDQNVLEPWVAAQTVEARIARHPDQPEIVRFECAPQTTQGGCGITQPGVQQCHAVG